MERGKIWDSNTNVISILFSLALIGLTFMGKVDPNDFVIATMLVLNYFFNKNSQKDAQQGAINMIERVTVPEEKK